MSAVASIRRAARIALLALGRSFGFALAADALSDEVSRIVGQRSPDDAPANSADECDAVLHGPVEGVSHAQAARGKIAAFERGLALRRATAASGNHYARSV